MRRRCAATRAWKNNFFTEDNGDAEAIYAQHHTRDIRCVRQQPGGDTDKNDNTDDCQQQITEVDRFKVGFGTVAFHPALAKAELTTVISTDGAEAKRGAPAITRRQPRRRQHRRSRVDGRYNTS